MNSTSPFSHWNRLFGIPASRSRPQRISRIWHVEQLESRWNLSSPGATNWEMVVDNGAHDNRVDIVFLGDGYTASEIATIYEANIEAMLRHLFDEREDPFPRYRNFFNVTRIDVISADSGVDEPTEGISRDTALNATYRYDGSTERLAYISDTRANSYIADLPFAAEMRFVTLNSTKYGGGGGTYAVYAGNDPSSTEIALHELGHSFAHLGDQYDYGDSGNYSGSEPSEPDVTKFSSGDKWSEWLGYDQPGVGVIGAYEGARYYETGLYRPSENSKMRSLGQPFDAIGREAFIQRIYQYVRPIDAALATENPVSSSATLWADVVDPLVIQTQWYVDDQLIAGATGPYFVPADYGFGSGTHTVTLSAWDNTDWVRRGTEALQEQRQWIIGADLVTPGLVFSSSAEHLDLTEGGNALQYQFRLSAAPTQPVTIVIDGNGELDVSPSTIEFTPDNWNVSRTLTVSALSDEIVDGDDVGELVYRLESLDANYSALAVPQTRATVRDGTVAPPLNHAPQTQPVTLDVDSAWVDGTHVGTLTAFDSDPGQELTWAIVSGNETGLWTLDPATGALTLADASQLNPDGQPELILNVAVTDNGTPALTANAVVTLRIHDATHNPAIVLELHTFELEYRNRGSAAILDAQATVQTFGGNADLQGTKLQVRSTGRRAGKDRFVIVPGGGSNSGIAVDGSHISYQGIQIGTVIATRPKDGLQISLNSAANAVSVQALLRRVAFQTTAKKRVTRILELQLVGYHGADSEPHQIVVQTNLG